MKIKIISLIVYYFIRLINLTFRYRYVGLENKEIAKKKSPHNSYVYAIWHQNLIGGILSHSLRKQKYTMIISESKDGELVSVTCEKLGHVPSRGSSTRGGQKALVELVRNLKNGIPAALTVDGPKGPSKVVKFGVIEAAKLSNTCIVPFTAYPTKYWTLIKSWDQFRVPKPFCKMVVVIGEPIEVSSTIEKEEYEKLTLHIAAKINQCEEQAKEWLARNN
jgi:lysophospholipid acyltransferase (LPLAT)-like uncharacterized protein